MEATTLTLLHRALRQGRVVVCEGAASTILGPDPEPQSLTELHRRYVMAGARMLTACTFAVADPAHILHTVQAARTVVQDTDGCIVTALAGGLRGADAVAQLRTLAASGADAILYETVYDCNLADEILSEAAIEIPLMLSATFTDSLTLPSGESAADFAALAKRHKAIAAGANCGDSMDATLRGAEMLRGAAPMLIVRPSAGIPDSHGRYPLDPQQWADALSTLRGVIAGGCCGTTPEHIAAFVRTLNRKTS